MYDNEERYEVNYKIYDFGHTIKYNKVGWAEGTPFGYRLVLCIA